MHYSILISSLIVLFMLSSCVPQSDENIVKQLSTYDELVDLFRRWRSFENPPLLDDAPDYTFATFSKRRPEFNDLQNQLMAIDTSGWSIPQQVDWYIVWAEMNGYDFNDRVLLPWNRDPAFYKTVWMYRSDVPAHEGPTHHRTLEWWTYTLPLNPEEKSRLLENLKVILSLNEQAQKNLTDNARDLWITGIRDIRKQIDDLNSILQSPGIKEDIEIRDAIVKAIASTQQFADWLELKSVEKTGPSGIGKENYTWYQQNVHLVPLTWEDEVMLLKRELARAWSSLKLEEHRNRHLPPLQDAQSIGEYNALAEKSVQRFMHFLKDNEILTVRDYDEPALRAHMGQFLPKEKRHFFNITMHYDPRPLYSHFYHWFELAQMDHEPHKSEIRRNPLLYNIFDSRNEGMATAVEEMFMQAGMYDEDPRVREMVYILIAQRAARGLGSLYAHANEMTMEEAGSLHSEYTPRGWMKTEKELLIFEQHLYLRQPGYGTSYITGKYLLENAMAELARISETEGVEFTLTEYFDTLNRIGCIPASLAQWELTGMKKNTIPDM
ncbi:MAG TPA: hypothetical protein PKC30_03295 [Saprospiraceae bacterium]|nr:hypothetical protein [Saprospiraceae bacterium]